MAKFTVQSAALDDYVSKLSELEREKNLGRAVYAGAKVVADAITDNIKKIPVTNERGTPSKPIDGITIFQKRGLLEGFGLSKMKNENGFVNTKTGFIGYNATEGKQHTKQPNIMIARAVERGTSFRRAHPFVAPAVRKTRKPAEEAMAREFDKELKKKGF